MVHSMSFTAIESGSKSYSESYSIQSKVEKTSKSSSTSFQRILVTEKSSVDNMTFLKQPIALVTIWNQHVSSSAIFCRRFFRELVKSLTVTMDY